MSETMLGAIKRRAARKRSFVHDRDGVVTNGFVHRSHSIDVRERTKTALREGGKLLDPYVAVISRAKRCSRPVSIESIGKPHQSVEGSHTVMHASRSLTNIVQCRRCPECLRERAYEWGIRAVAEYRASSRTWFGTLTFAPEQRFRMLLETRQRLRLEGDDLDSITDEKRFVALLRTYQPDVSKFLKKLRNSVNRDTPIAFRYFLTAEPHQDWSPHYHILIHEVSELMPIRKSVLEAKWTHGLCHWRLLNNDRGAYYASKYLAKYSFARVKASNEYGKPPKVLRAEPSLVGDVLNNDWSHAETVKEVEKL